MQHSAQLPCSVWRHVYTLLNAINICSCSNLTVHHTAMAVYRHVLLCAMNARMHTQRWQWWRLPCIKYHCQRVYYVPDRPISHLAACDIVLHCWVTCIAHAVASRCELNRKVLEDGLRHAHCNTEIHRYTGEMLSVVRFLLVCMPRQTSRLIHSCTSAFDARVIFGGENWQN